MIYILERDNEEAIDDSRISYEAVSEERYFKQTMMSGLVIIMVLCIVSVIMSCVVLNKIDKLTMIETVPETTISSIVESTAAPVTIETSMPETEETIHITKEPSVKPTTAPTKEPTKAPTTSATKKPTKAPTTVPTTTRATVAPAKKPTKPTSTPATQANTPTVDPDELELLACVIYQEAGGNASCDDCRRYVADIVLNRVKHESFPNTIEDVLTQRDQYGRFFYTGVKWPQRAKYDTEKDAVERAYRIAEEVLSGNHSALYGNGYIWQAQFVQGNCGFWCCGHWYGK